ncbi:unnamed protein product [Mytilus coruscus]|uniref:Reverse transcriptase domain-containing protein n=1 Tax=Mytilus coruscus TaxID=42192 RepID=A0A6J8EIK7_MYTCO|nr:unnamed protein product [Mytilus coruscus]
MYNNIFLQVRLNDKLTDKLKANIGVRQGDNLSPNLFKIFVNDLPYIFDDYCVPAEIGSTKINCLMYADDVVLLSTSQSGLSRCLNKLEEYCKRWCIQVNLKKTKIVIFNKGVKMIKSNFYFNGEPVENVRNYKSLGVIFSASGSFSRVRYDLYQRG